MRTLARARFLRVSARKARLVLDQIRGKSVADALATLQFTPRAAARIIEKIVRSAVANAEHNHQVRNLDDLRVHYAVADGGPSMKRVQPRAMGRAFFIRHKTSHLTIGVTDEASARATAPASRSSRRGPASSSGARAPRWSGSRPSCRCARAGDLPQHRRGDPPRAGRPARGRERGPPAPEARGLPARHEEGGDLV